MEKIHSTTILCIRKNDELCMIADSLATAGSVVVKSNVKKIRAMDAGHVLCGFAGSVSDAFILLGILESKLKVFRNLLRASYALSEEWRLEKRLRHLEASLIVADKSHILSISGDGNILDCNEEGMTSIGSGSLFAISAARALARNTDFSARKIAEESMKIAGETCIYTNTTFSIYEINKQKDGSYKVINNKGESYSDSKK